MNAGPAASLPADGVERLGPRLQALREVLTQAQRTERHRAGLALTFGGIGLLLPLGALEAGLVTGWPLALLAYLVPLAALVAWRGRASEHREQTAAAIDWISEQIGCSRGEPRDRAIDDGARFHDAEHPFASDLDLFGRGSLYERIGTRCSPLGARALARMLRTEGLQGTRAERAAAISELVAKVDVREALAVAARQFVHRKGIEASHLAEIDERWVALREERYGTLELRGQPFMRYLLVAHFAIAATAVFLQWAPAAWLLCAVVINLLVSATAKDLPALEARFGRLRHALRPARELLTAASAARFENPILQRIVQSFHLPATGGAVVALRDLERATSMLEERRNPFQRFTIGIALLRDLAARDALAAWDRRAGQELHGWLDAMAELEALTALANLAAVGTDRTLAEEPQADEFLHVKNLAHPLLDPKTRVGNDLHVPRSPSIILITGSNMSGKSTFLRALGLASLFAELGLPIAAHEARLPRLHIVTCMRVQDSLQEGRSRFLAEVRRLALAVRKAAERGPSLVLLDEILSGTNSEDRHEGTLAVLRGLVKHDVLALVATHDLRLASLAEELPGKVDLQHFQDTGIGSALDFDYRLRPGLCPVSNALRLLAAAGLPVHLGETDG